MRRSRRRSQSASINDFTNYLGLTEGHDVNAGDSFQLAQLLDELNTDIYALAPLFCGPLEPFDGAVGNPHPGNLVSHPASALGRGEWPDADQKPAPLMQAAVSKAIKKMP